MVTGASRVLIVAAAAACGAALAQPPPDAVPAERERQLLDEVDALRSDAGLHAEGLIEPLRALGMLYQEAGNHDLAVVALREARQVLRANRGLFSASVEEALLLNQQIRSEKALGNGEQAWNLQHDLTVIARQHLDDTRMLPIFMELIEDRTQRLDQFSTTSFADRNFESPSGAVAKARNSRSVKAPADRAAESGLGTRPHSGAQRECVR